MSARAALLQAVLAAAVPGAPIAARPGDVAVRGDLVYTMAGAPLKDGVVVVQAGKITAVGPAASTPLPAGLRVLRAKVVTPGLIDAHSVVGLAGWLNQPQDQDQLEGSAPLQPELRAIDAYNPEDRLIAWLRGLGVTTIHTGHAPGAVIAGETLIAKTRGRTVEEAVIVPRAMLAATLGESARAEEGKSPGTRSKMVALLRAELVKAQDDLAKRASAEAGKEPDRNLRTEALVRVLKGEVPLLLTAQRAHDIASALRLQREFSFRLVLDGAAEAYLLEAEILAAKLPVIVHPVMQRAFGDSENLGLETPARLKKAGILTALQGGFESYVPKTRVVLFEAAQAAAHGLSTEEALALVTVDAARLLGIEARVGSLRAGRDGDLALFDGDPLETVTHCVGTVIEGQVVSETAR